FRRRRAANAPQRSEPSAAATTEADTAAMMAAAQDLKDLLIAAYTDDNQVHAETVLGAAAALTGEFALRAAGVPIPSGGFVLGDPINDVLIESKTEVTLWDVLKMTTDVTPLTEDKLPDPIEIIRRIAQEIAAIKSNGRSGNFPPLSVPHANYPQEWSPN